jgi:hypothetical protein
MPVAKISALKPAGSFILSSGISGASVTVIFPASGASFESAIDVGMPCFQAGGGAGAAAGA